jgi:rare lipoprotein A
MAAGFEGKAECLRSERRFASTAGKLVGISVIALFVANCASQPTGPGRQHHSKEIGAFSHPKYGKASPRVVGLDDDAPKGGGRFQVGRPYTVAGRRYVPREKPEGYSIAGLASWYGIAFHGRKTANGEIYDRNSVSAAHPTMPLPSYARVTNLANNHSIIVRVNDRGPYHAGRVLDVSEKTANLLQFRHIGTARVKVDYLGPASLAGSDDTRLIASLSTNGPARSPGGNTAPTMVASIEPVATARPQRSSALLSFTSQQDDNTVPVTRARPAPEPAVVTQTRFVPAVDAPLPPARPFDLDTIGGAAVPVSPGSLPNAVTGQRMDGAPLPPARPTDLSFVAMEGGLSKFAPSHPFHQFERFETLQPARGSNR